MSADQLAVIAIMFAGLGIFITFVAFCAAVASKLAPAIDRSNVLTGGDES